MSAGQEQTGEILGTVKDASGGMLTGAELAVTSPSLIRLTRTRTDSAGHFRFPALPPGVYELSASQAGFNPAKVPGLELVLGKTLKVALVLEVAGVSENVTVIHDAPQIDVKKSASATSIREAWIHKLPRGRDYTSIVSQVPGVSNEQLLGGVSIEGASASENLYIVDGMETTNLIDGLPEIEVVTDFLEEVEKTAVY